MTAVTSKIETYKAACANSRTWRALFAGKITRETNSPWSELPIWADTGSAYMIKARMAWGAIVGFIFTGQAIVCTWRRTRKWCCKIIWGCTNTSSSRPSNKAVFASLADAINIRGTTGFACLTAETYNTQRVLMIKWSSENQCLRRWDQDRWGWIEIISTRL